MTRARIFIALTGLVFVAFGLWGFFAPAAMMDNFRITLSDPSARTAIRAIYGGTLTGIGALYVYLAASADRTRNGLWAIVIITGAVLSARLVGMAVDRATSTFHLAYAGLEIIGIGLAVIFLRSMPTAAGEQPE